LDAVQGPRVQQLEAFVDEISTTLGEAAGRLPEDFELRVLARTLVAAM
jgi:hypothetical protein